MFSGRMTPFVIASRTSATDLPEKSSRSAAFPAAAPAFCPRAAAVPARLRPLVAAVRLREDPERVLEERELDERADEDFELDERDEARDPLAFDPPERDDAERDPPDFAPPERDEPDDRELDEREPEDDERELEPPDRRLLDDPPLPPDFSAMTAPP